MKKWILISALAMSGFLNAQHVNLHKTPEPVAAEKQLNPEQRAKRDAGRAEQNLGLNAEQKTKWEAAALERINTNSALKEKLRASTSESDKKQCREQMKANAKKFDETVVAFLSPDQKVKWDAQKQERRAKHKRHQHNSEH